MLVMVSGNPYHSPSEVAGGEGFHNDLFMPVLSKAEKVDAGDTGGNGQCMYLLVAGYQTLTQNAYALRNFKADKVGATHKAVLF